SDWSYARLLPFVITGDHISAFSSVSLVVFSVLPFLLFVRRRRFVVVLFSK
ncbi:hypothetical protein E2562_007521, partial [Oryza meyeriana var. granulata]